METLKSGQVPALVTNAEVMQILATRTKARDKHDAEAAAAAEGSATNGGRGSLEGVAGGWRQWFSSFR